MDPQKLKRVFDDLIPFHKHLGMRVAEMSEELVRLEIPFRDELVGDASRPALHGGVLSTLTDAAGGGAVWCCVTDERARVSTIDLRIDYLRPGKLDLLVAEARVVKMGNRVGVADVRLFNGSSPDVTIATGKGVYNISIRRDADAPKGPAARSI